MTLPMIDKLGITNEYKLFKEIPLVPFAVWWIEAEKFGGSDETWRVKSQKYVIELFTSEKDFELEEKFEEAIPASDIEKTEEYIISENVFCITYRYTVIKKRRLKQ
jgi:hypothetical protein